MPDHESNWQQATMSALLDERLRLMSQLRDRLLAEDWQGCTTLTIQLQLVEAKLSVLHHGGTQ